MGHVTSKFTQRALTTERFLPVLVVVVVATAPPATGAETAEADQPSDHTAHHLPHQSTGGFNLLFSWLFMLKT